MIFTELFGRKIEDKKIEFEDALLKIKELKENGFIHLKYQVKYSKSKYAVKKPEYSEVLGILENHLAPYQYNHNPNLKGETSVRHIIRDFSSRQIQDFHFKQTIDNLFKKGISGNHAKLRLSKKK